MKRTSVPQAAAGGAAPVDSYKYAESIRDKVKASLPDSQDKWPSLSDEWPSISSIRRAIRFILEE
jgi:hypothetical protein